jgi:hypothetical protein
MQLLRRNGDAPSVRSETDLAVDAAVPSRAPGLGNWVFHPFLLAAYPILALFADNAQEVRSAEAGYLTALAVSGSCLLWLFFRLLLKDARRAGLITSLSIAAFFAFGYLLSGAQRAVDGLTELWAKTPVSVPPALVFVVELLVLFCLARLIVRKVTYLGGATSFMNLFALFLVAIPAVRVFSVKSPSLGRPPYQPTGFALGSQTELSRRPDIYYIILDGYARSDIMKSYFKYDNSAFLRHLEQKGFYLAPRSTANYCQTALSLSSSLNASFLDKHVKGLGIDQTELNDLIGNNNVLATLKPLGYKFVTFATGFSPTEHPEADDYRSPRPNLTEFQWMVVDATPLRLFWDNPRYLQPPMLSRERILYLLDHLPDVAADPAPTFTFAHLLCPHRPFLFGENGEEVHMRNMVYNIGTGERFFGRFPNPRDYCRAYRAQSAFITRRIEATIDRLLAVSPLPPIIILQSDHGSELMLDMEDVAHTDVVERMSVLNAYFFPDGRYEKLYESISPINSFRVLFNTFFGAKLELLADKSYFSTWHNPYRFIDVTDQVRSPASAQPAARVDLQLTPAPFAKRGEQAAGYDRMMGRAQPAAGDSTDAVASKIHR